MNWFKLYTEARNDAKLRSLTDAQHRVWFRLLCYAAEQPERGTIRGLPIALVATEVADGDQELLSETCNALQALQGVTWRYTALHGVEITFVNFAKRQKIKPSDRPERIKERVTKHRIQRTSAKHKNGNAPVTPCNAPETPRNAHRDRYRDRENTPPTPPGGGVGACVSSPLPDSHSAPTPGLPDEPFVPPASPDSAVPPPPVANDPAEVDRVAARAERLFPGLDWGPKVRQVSGDVPTAHLDYALDAAYSADKRSWPYVLGVLRRVAVEGLPDPGTSPPRPAPGRKPEPRPSYLDPIPYTPPRPRRKADEHFDPAKLSPFIRSLMRA